MKQQKPTKSRQERDKDAHDKRKNEEFYEVMPGLGDHYVYRDDAPKTDPKMISIVTMVLVLLVVIALALLFTRGLELIIQAR